MKIKGFELNARMAYDVILASTLEGENVLLNYAKIVYDSIKLNWKWFNRFWYRWKYSPSKLLKSHTKDQIILAVKHIRFREGASKEDLTFLDYQLGMITVEEFLKYVEESKKKAQKLNSLTKNMK